MASYSAKAFRRSTLHYTGGRIANALIAFFIFVLIARYLPEDQYASYVAAFAWLEIALIFFNFGMDWVTAVFVPEVRLKANGRVLQRFVWTCASLQMLMLSIGALILAGFASQVAELLAMPNAIVIFQLYAVVMFVEGLGRVFRDQLLSCLLLQGAAQVSQFARNLVMLGFVLLLGNLEQWRNAHALAYAEIAASGLSLLLAIGSLAVFLLNVRLEPAQDPTWQPPTWRRVLLAGRNAWVSNIANLTWSGQAVVLLLARFTSVELMASIGFARNLSEQIRRFLPMEFLLGILRTLLVARYVKDGDPHQLGLRCGIMYRVNLMFLLPILCVVIVSGSEVCELLSKGRYAAAHWLLASWLMVLIFWAHHRVTDLMAHALGKSELTSRSSTRLLITPLLVVSAAYFQAWQGIFFILAISELAYSWMVLSAINIYRPNWQALAKVGCAAIITLVTLSQFSWGKGTPYLIVETALAFCLLCSLVAMLRAWTNEEAQSLRFHAHSSVLVT